MGGQTTCDSIKKNDQQKGKKKFGWRRKKAKTDRKTKTLNHSKRDFRNQKGKRLTWEKGSKKKKKKSQKTLK